MASTQIAEKVIAIIAEYQSIPQEEISWDSEFADMGIDSLAALGIIAELENEFNIAISNEKALQIVNVGQVIESIEEELAVAQEN